MRIFLFRTIFLGFCCLVIINTTAQTPCVLTCPDNITVASTSASGVVVNYSAPTSSGDCGTITSLPASGSTFPIGTTTVNVYKNASQLVYALKANTLVAFNISDPSVISSPLAITGLQSGESIRSIDFRPANSQLYAVGAVSSSGNIVGRLYTINTTTGAATQIGSGTFPLPSELFASSVTASIDFDPVTDILRLIAAGGVNMRINPNLGTYATDGVLDPNDKGVSGIAYTNNVPFATSTTLYGLGFSRPPLSILDIISLYNIQDPNKGTLALIGTTGMGTSFLLNYKDLDISQTGAAFASRTGSGMSSLYSINLATGNTISLGQIGTSIEGFSIAPASYTEPSCSFTITVTPPPPTVTINKAASQSDPTTGTPVKFTVVFSEEVTGFDASDISFAGSTAPGTLVATVTGTGPTYTVSVNGMTGAGNVVASVIAGAATNNCNQSSLASTSTDNTVQLLVFSHDFVITKTTVSPFVAEDGVITYTVTVGRIQVPNGPFLQGVVVTDILPAGTTFVGFQPLQFNIPILPTILLPPANNGALSLSFPVFEIGDFYSFRLQVKVDDGITGSISNTATVGGPLGDVNPVNNSATAVVQIAVPPTITCPANITLYTSSETCTVEYAFSQNFFTVTGSPAPVISINASSGAITFTTNDIAVNPLTAFLQKGVYTVNVTATNIGGTADCSYTITVIDNSPPSVECQQDIKVSADPGLCSAKMNLRFGITELCSLPISYNVDGITGVLNFTNISAGFEKTYPVGTRTVNAVFTDAAGNSSTCAFQVIVLDNEKPVITNCPSAVTVSCASQVPAANISSVTATDNCGTPTITHVGDVITNQTCANKYTITRIYKATDGVGNTATCSQTITVDDITPPTITGLTPSKRILAPPNHKMVDVTLAYTINDNCVSTPNVTVNITSNEPINGTGDGDTDPDWEVIDARHIRLRAERAGQGTGRIYTITVTVSDGCNAPVSATTEVMVVHNITAPHSGNSYKVGSTVAFAGEFWDVPGNKHTAKWSIDGTSVSGVVTEPVGAKNGKVTGSYKFTTPGVYKLQMNVTDQKGVTTYANTNGDLEAIVVIYDPNGGYTYGGGYYNSPAGALVSNPSSTGKASYGFAMNYFKNSTNPKGEAQFEFKVGDFEFNALNFDYLVISNSMAQFKGTGKIIGGQSGIGFTMTVVDGQLDGTGVDRIRMKIYNKNGKVIYDNQPGASDAALPTQTVGLNSIVVISGTNNSTLTKSNTTSQNAEMENAGAKVSEGLNAIVYPNPASSYFSISINSNDAKEKILLQVFDQYGRSIEVRNNVSNGSTIRIGDLYRSGVYYVRIIQGKQHKEVKLVKLN